MLLEEGPAHGSVAALPTGRHVFTARPVDGCHPSCPQPALETGGGSPAAAWCDMRVLLGTVGAVPWPEDASSWTHGRALGRL